MAGAKPHLRDGYWGWGLNREGSMMVMGHLLHHRHPMSVAGLRGVLEGVMGTHSSLAVSPIGTGCWRQQSRPWFLFNAAPQYLIQGISVGA